jgi:FtsH-binding integral membrane protein
MAMGPERGYLNPARTDVGQIDVGLRQYMLSVYNYMTGGLAVTGVIAFLISISPSVQMAIWGSPLRYVAMFAPIAVVLFFSFRIQKMSFGTAQLTYWVYAALMGLSLSFIFLAYTGTSIARVFFITAGTFAATSLYGYTTRRDLTGFGSFLFMGLIGIIIASVVNMIWPSGALTFAISVIGVLVFVGLTAYDTQKIKEMYDVNEDGTVTGRKAVMGALSLYLDFINLFLFLLRLVGDRR